MKKAFKISIIIKKTSQVFIKNEPAGVIAIKELEFDLRQDEYEGMMFLANLIDQEETFKRDIVEIKTEEIK